MIEVTNSVGAILAFDGRVIEDFNLQSSKRIHINHVKSIEVKEGRKGDLWINVRTPWQQIDLTKIDPSQQGVVDEFVAQVNAARS